MIEIYLECDECGGELETNKSVLQNNLRDIIMYIIPCKKCEHLRKIGGVLPEKNRYEKPKENGPKG